MALVTDINSTPHSGLNHIDALLDDGPGWNWLTPVRKVIYYTFSVTSGNEVDVSEISGGITAFNSAQQSTCLSQLAYISQLTGITFSPTTNGTAADLHFAYTNIVSSASTSGLCSWNYDYSSYEGSNIVTSYTASAYVYLDNTEWGTENGSPTTGSSGYETLLHELGHAMGLKHPFEDTPTLSSAEDNTANSIMSYTSSGGPYSTFSPYDVAALMWIYGGDGLGGSFGVSTTGEYIMGNSNANTITGGSGNDKLEGLAGNDTINGGTGNDSLTGGGGNDTVTGGTGSDTAIFSGNFADYTVTYDAASSSFSITDKTSGRDGTDLVTGVETFQFADTTKTSSSMLPDTTVPPSIPTNAKVFLGSGDNSFTLSNSGATLYGNTGVDVVTIADRVTGVILDQNIERIKFFGESNSYTFKQTGNMINIYDATGLIVKAPVQGDSDGTLLSFSNCTASTKLAGGVMSLGGRAVSSVTAEGVTPLTTISEPSTTNVTNAKVFLGSGNDSFTVSSIGTTIYGNTGNDAVTIASAASAVSLDQNIERIIFSAKSSNYAFRQTGNIINIYDAANITHLLAKAPVQGDTDGTILSFSDGIAEAHLAVGVMTLAGTTVNSDIPTTLTLVGIVADIGL